MSSLKKIVKKVSDPLGIIFKDEPKIEIPETKTPAQQLDRQQEVGAEEIQMGTDTEADTAAKGKRSLVRPVASSLGGM